MTGIINSITPPDYQKSDKILFKLFSDHLQKEVICIGSLNYKYFNSEVIKIGDKVDLEGQWVNDPEGILSSFSFDTVVLLSE